MGAETGDAVITADWRMIDQLPDPVEPVRSDFRWGWGLFIGMALICMCIGTFPSFTHGAEPEASDNT